MKKISENVSVSINSNISICPTESMVQDLDGVVGVPGVDGVVDVDGVDGISGDNISGVAVSAVSSTGSILSGSRGFGLDYIFEKYIKINASIKKKQN